MFSDENVLVHLNKLNVKKKIGKVQSHIFVTHIMVYIRQYYKHMHKKSSTLMITMDTGPLTEVY